MKVRKFGRLVFINARPAIQAEQGKEMTAYALSKSLLFKLADFINDEVRGINIAASSDCSQHHRHPYQSTADARSRSWKLGEACSPGRYDRTGTI